MIKSLRIVVPLWSILTFTSCTEPRQDSPDNLQLSVKESDLTSVTLSLHTQQITYPATLTLTRNSQPVQTFSLNQPDTTLLDTALTPSTGYSWQVQMKKTESTFLKSDAVTGRTMDTTSHDFTWRVDTLGTWGIAQDVAWIADDNVWVVGKFYTDPNGTGRIYNAAHWNGHTWELHRIITALWGGFKEPTGLQAIYAFSKNDVWAFSEAGSYAHYDGLTWKSEYVTERQGGITKMWGSDPDNIFFIGTNGTMTHYNGTTFTLMPTGTSIELLDITGTDDKTVWISGYNPNDYKRIFMKYENGTFQVISRKLIYAIWANPSNPDQIWTIDEFAIEMRSVKNPGVAKKRIKGITYFPLSMSGTAENNLWVVGHFLSILHYNGSTLKTYNKLLGDGVLYRVRATPAKVYAVGTIFTGLQYRPIVITGSR